MLRTAPEAMSSSPVAGERCGQAAVSPNDFSAISRMPSLIVSDAVAPGDGALRTWMAFCRLDDAEVVDQLAGLFDGLGAHAGAARGQVRRTDLRHEALQGLRELASC